MNQHLLLKHLGVALVPEPDPAPFSLSWGGGDKWKMAAYWCSEVKDLRGLTGYVQTQGLPVSDPRLSQMVDHGYWACLLLLFLTPPSPSRNPLEPRSLQA